MAVDHIEKLNRFRAILIDRRRRFVSTVVDRAGSDQFPEVRLSAIQLEIDAVERAIEHEQKLVDFKDGPV